MEWLNYHHLLYFWMVAREGGLAPAGKVLRLSQSAISGQIASLQQSLGQPLFERRGRKLELTETGRVVFRYADEIFGLGRELLDAVRGRPTGRPARLVVGISDVVPKLLVRKLLAPAFHQREKLTLVCHEDRFDRLLAELATHAVDVVIADSPVPPDAAVRAYHHLLGESTVTCVAPANLAPALRRGFPRGLDRAPVLLPISGSTLRRNLDGWFETHSLRPELVAEADDSALLNAFAADGMGALFVPTVIADVVVKRYDLASVAEIPELRERFYAVSVERRLAHPAVVAIRAAARSDVFA
ncbi:MAG: LysR substrate-binding domain-containing protein [Myxococcota bacterium]|nr:LysR substrate-binding domain-containing protein [Myxococcota bacterium]